MDESQYMPSRTMKGILFMALGAIILMQLFGWFERWLPHLILLGAIGLLLYGAYIANVHKKVMELISRLFTKPQQ